MLRIKDVGSVDRTFQKREVVSRLEGGESVELAIYREAGANIVELADRIKSALYGSEEQQRKAAQMEDGATTVGEREAVAFLASPAAGYITGHVLRVNGGLLIS